MSHKNLESNNKSLKNQILSKYPFKIGKVLVIGMGASGILTLRNLKKINASDYMTIKCFELNSKPCGIWNLNNNVNLSNHTKFNDINGNRFVTPMYPSLTTNIPGKLMSINDLPEIGSDEVYPTHSVILSYLNNLVKIDNLEDFVSFNTKVIEVNYLTETNEWQVKFINLVTKEQSSEKFDCIVDCSSFINIDNIPHWEGLKEFNKKYPNRLIHSRYYRQASEFRDKTVIVVGKGPSAMNIVQELSYEQCNVTQSSRPIPINKLGDKFLPYAPNNPTNLPIFANPIKGFEVDLNSSESDNDSIILEDGSKLCIPDYIVSATGYKFEFVTLPKDSENPLQPSNSNIIVNDCTIKNLVLRAIYRHNPTFMTIGALTITSLIPLWDYQAHLVVNSISMVNYFHETGDYKPLLELVGCEWILANENCKGEDKEEELIMSRSILPERYSYPINLSLRINRAHSILPDDFKQIFPVAIVDPPSNEWIEEATKYSLGLPPYNRD